MKFRYALAASLLISISAFAQKDELKALKKITDKDAPPTKEEIQKFKDLIIAAEPKMGAATKEQQADFYYYKAQGGVLEIMTDPAVMGNPQKAFGIIGDAVDNLNKVVDMEKTGKKNHTKEIQEVILPELKIMIGTVAAQLSEAKMYKEAAALYGIAYKADPNDKVQLYNAAAMAVNGQDYDNALNYYIELDKSGFTGEGTSYVAKNKKSGQVEAFPNKSTRDIAIKTGEYVDPKDEKLPSLKGEITKNIALIYLQKGENDKAKAAMAAARKNNPDDVNLIVSEANIYYQAKDMEGYKRLINEAAAKNPKNAELFYNLGVVASETDAAEAEAQYKKALEIDPNFTQALIAMGTLMLKGEQKIVDEMNKLGTSAKDNQRYDVLKKQKDGLYQKALPYLEKAHKVDPKNQDAIILLSGIYQALERMDEHKAMKAKLK
jgi:tetratricopeptide (TPR) repeat protein